MSSRHVSGSARQSWPASRSPEAFIDLSSPVSMASDRELYLESLSAGVDELEQSQGEFNAWNVPCTPNVAGWIPQTPVTPLTPCATRHVPCTQSEFEERSVDNVGVHPLVGSRELEDAIGESMDNISMCEATIADQIHGSAESNGPADVPMGEETTDAFSHTRWQGGSMTELQGAIPEPMTEAQGSISSPRDAPGRMEEKTGWFICCYYRAYAWLQ